MKWPVWLEIPEFRDGQRLSANANVNVLIARQNILIGMFGRKRRLFQQSWLSGDISPGMPSVAWQGSCPWKDYLGSLYITCLWHPQVTSGSVTLKLQVFAWTGSTWDWITVDSDTRTTSTSLPVYFKDTETYELSLSGFSFYNNEVRARFIMEISGQATAAYIRVCKAYLGSFQNVPSWTSLSFSSGEVLTATKLNQLRANQNLLAIHGRFPNLSSYAGWLQNNTSGHDILWAGTFKYLGYGQILANFSVSSVSSESKISFYLCSYNWHQDLGGTRILVAEYDTPGSYELQIDLTDKGLTSGNFYALFIEGDNGALIDLYDVYITPRASEIRPSWVINQLVDWAPGDVPTADLFNAIYYDCNMLYSTGPLLKEDLYPLTSYVPFSVTNPSEEVIEGVYWHSNLVAKNNTGSLKLTNFYRWLYYRGTNVKISTSAHQWNPSISSWEPVYESSLPDATGPIVCADLESLSWIVPGLNYTLRGNIWVAYEFYESTI